MSLQQITSEADLDPVNLHLHILAAAAGLMLISEIIMHIYQNLSSHIIVFDSGCLEESFFLNDEE